MLTEDKEFYKKNPHLQVAEVPKDKNGNPIFQPIDAEVLTKQSSVSTESETYGDLPKI